MTFWDAVHFWVAKGLVIVAGAAVMLTITLIFVTTIARYEMWREQRHIDRIPKDERCSMCGGRGSTQGQRCHTCAGTGRRHHFV